MELAHVGGYDQNAATLIESTAPGIVLGTPSYMSPEQVRGEEADHRSDIFAFGAILYEMLSGQRAFRRDTNPRCGRTKSGRSNVKPRFEIACVLNVISFTCSTRKSEHKAHSGRAAFLHLAIGCPALRSQPKN